MTKKIKYTLIVAYKKSRNNIKIGYGLFNTLITHTNKGLDHAQHMEKSV